jgi:hypothetical protein
MFHEILPVTKQNKRIGDKQNELINLWILFIYILVCSISVTIWLDSCSFLVKTSPQFHVARVLNSTCFGFSGVSLFLPFHIARTHFSSDSSVLSFHRLPIQ